MSLLNITDEDKAILTQYRDTLTHACATFRASFNDYLLASPSTASLYHRFQNAGGNLDTLINEQLRSLMSFLTAGSDTQRNQQLAAIGALNHQQGVEPECMMGIYRHFFDHLEQQLAALPNYSIENQLRLRNSVGKFLFRDLGLIIGGYWQTTLKHLRAEQQKVGSLQEQINGLLTNIPQLLWSFDVTGDKPLYLSPNLARICQVSGEFPIPLFEDTIAEDRKTLELAWYRALQGHPVEVESRVKTAGQPMRWFKRALYPYKDASGRVLRIDGIMEDTTELKRNLERLNTLATTDSLTGLTNRLLFNDRLEQSLALAERNNGQQLAVLLMDLNHFKEINDTLGHQVGDEVLVQVAHLLKEQINRRSDTLARLGGDEFGVLLTAGEAGGLSAEHICRKIEAAFDRAFTVQGREIYLGVSIGVALYPEHGTDASTLLRRADIAMYSAKRAGIGHSYYRPDQDLDAQQNFSLANDLRHAMKNQELFLEYQPKVNLQDYSVTSAEALIRWLHPEKGLLNPFDFIPIAERSGQIIPITEYVIETAVKQVAHWQTLGVTMSVAINLSAKVFQQWGNLTFFIHQTLRKYKLPGKCLEIEITENVLMSDLVAVRKILNHITKLGVTIAIDDFGTGYSSLAYLKSLPLNTLKIDKSFVMDMINDENDAMIVKSTIDLAHNLGLSVVAEGIENAQTLSLLGQWRCDGAQGYYLGKPLSAIDFMLSVESGVYSGVCEVMGMGL